MDPNFESVEQSILEHCREAGISFDDFRDIWVKKINEDPNVFDCFFELRWSELSEVAKDARIELLIDIFT